MFNLLQQAMKYFANIFSCWCRPWEIQTLHQSGDLKCRDTLNAEEPAEGSIRSQPRADKAGSKILTNYLWVQWGTYIQKYLETGHWAAELPEKTSPPPLSSAESKACTGYVQSSVSVNISFPLQNTTSEREQSSSLDAYGNAAGRAKTENKGKLSRMEYLVL